MSIFVRFISFLGHVVTEDGIIVDPDKIIVIYDWVRHTCLIKIWNFISLAGSYRCLVDYFSSIMDTLTKLTHKSHYFIGWIHVRRDSKSLKSH